MQPKVSVLIPCYNAAAFIEEAIESVLQQTFTDFELVVVDNASTDDTPTLVKKFLADSRVSFYQNAENIGMAGNFNRCLALAKGAYIKFLMADDLFHPLLLERFVTVMDAHQNVSLVTSNRYLFNHSGQKEEFITPLHGLQHGKKVIFESLSDWNWIGEPTTVMFRRKNMDLGLFNPDYKYFLDWDMWLRHLTVGDCFFISEPLSYFRLHDQQTTQELKTNYRLFFEEYLFYKTLRSRKPYDIGSLYFNPKTQIKNKSSNLLKIGIKLLFKGQVRQWKVAYNAIKTGWKDALVPEAIRLHHEDFSE